MFQNPFKDLKNRAQDQNVSNPFYMMKWRWFELSIAKSCYW